MHGGSIAPSGELTMKVTRGPRNFPPSLWPSVTLKTFIEHGLPHRGLGREVNTWRIKNLRHLWRGAWRVGTAHVLGIPTYYGALWITKRHGDGRIVEYGLASMRVVTTAGVGYIVDSLQNIVEPENLKFHGFGTGSTAEASADTALVTELTTEYNPNSTRPTGTTAEGASANIYRTVATLTPDSGTPVLREHGVFSQAATGGGVLLDRTVFAAVTLDSSLGDSLAVTYELTFPAGS